MRRLLTLGETLSVSDQLQPTDLAELAKKGVRTIICNRPNNEEPNQPDSAALAAAAQALGMHFIDQPISFSTIQPRDGETFRAHLEAAEGVTHAFCRSGRRCVALWAMAHAKSLGTQGVLQRAAEVGEDLRGLAPMLAEIESQ